MKICMLETSPKGKLVHRNENIDIFFVTHDEYNPEALSFNKGMSWAKNRNYLFTNRPSNYDYYWFTDYDVKYTSDTELSVVDQIKKDLIDYNPLVLVCDSKSKNYPKKNNAKVQSLLFSNNQMKIVHKSVIDLFFPMPTIYGGIWDTCHYFNVIESCFLGKVAVTSNVYCEGVISEARSQGNMDSMSRIHSDLNICLLKDNNLSHNEFKLLYQQKGLETELIKEDIDVQNFYNSMFNESKLRNLKNKK
jgi:hypothetical protein